MTADHSQAEASGTLRGKNERSAQICGSTLEARSGQARRTFGAVPPSLRAKRSNPSGGIKKEWIASSLRFSQ
jgi:hypothetical protein